MSAHSELKRGRRLLGSNLLENSAKGWDRVHLLEELIYLHAELICVCHVFWKVPTFPSFCLFSFRPVCIFLLILIKLFHLHIPDALWEIITVLGHFIDLVLYGRHCTESAEMNKSDTMSAFGKCLFISRPDQLCHKPSKDQHLETAVLRLFASLLYQTKISDILLR